MGIESWCLLSLAILILCALFVLDLRLFLCLVYGHTTLVVVSYCPGFSWFTCLCLFLPFYVLSLWNWLGKEEVNGARGEVVWYSTGKVRPR